MQGYIFCMQDAFFLLQAGTFLRQVRVVWLKFYNVKDIQAPFLGVLQKCLHCLEITLLFTEGGIMLFVLQLLFCLCNVYNSAVVM